MINTNNNDTDNINSDRTFAKKNTFIDFCYHLVSFKIPHFIFKKSDII